MTRERFRTNSIELFAAHYYYYCYYLCYQYYLGRLQFHGEIEHTHFCCDRNSCIVIFALLMLVLLLLLLFLQTINLIPIYVFDISMETSVRADIHLICAWINILLWSVRHQSDCSLIVRCADEPTNGTWKKMVMFVIGNIRWAFALFILAFEWGGGCFKIIKEIALTVTLLATLF